MSWFVMRVALGVLMLFATACGPRRYALVSPLQAADLAEEFHHRVRVVGIKSPSRPLEPVDGVLTADADIDVGDDRTRKLDPDDRVLLRVDYAEGDHALNGGIVHRGRSYEKIAAGVTLLVLGAAAFAGVVAGGASNCVQGPPSGSAFFDGWGELGYAGCVLGWSALGGAALAMGVAGLALTIRGAMRTNLSVTPVGSWHGAGASLKLTF